VGFSWGYPGYHIPQLLHVSTGAALAACWTATGHVRCRCCRYWAGATLPEEPPIDRCHAGRSEYRACRCQLLLCMPGDMAVWKASGTIYSQRRGQDSQRKEFGSAAGAASRLCQLGITVITVISLAAAPSACASQARSGISICPSSLFRLRRIQPSAQVAARLSNGYLLLSCAESMRLACSPVFSLFSFS